MPDKVSDSRKIREAGIGENLPAGYIEKHGLIDPSTVEDDEADDTEPVSSLSGERERFEAADAVYVLTATGDGAFTHLVYGMEALQQAIHSCFCDCDKPWQQCTTEGSRQNVESLDDDDKWSHDYPDYSRHVWTDHGEDYTLTVARVTQAARSHSQPDAPITASEVYALSHVLSISAMTPAHGKKHCEFCAAAENFFMRASTPTLDGRGDAAEQGDAKLPPFICKCGHTHGEHRFDLVADPFCEECECEAYAGPMPPTQKEMLENAQLAARKLAEALREAKDILAGEVPSWAAARCIQKAKATINAALAAYSSSVEGKATIYLPNHGEYIGQSGRA